MPQPKLPRATLEQKIQILDYYHQSNRPQLETVDRYKNEISISTSSFSEWLKNEDDLRERLSHTGMTFSKNSRRKVKFKYEKINYAMDLLVQQRLERNEPINEPILREYWSMYAHKYGVDDPKRLAGFSHGWLSQFKKRHGLNKRKMKISLRSPSVSLNEGSNGGSDSSDSKDSKHDIKAGDAFYEPTFVSNPACSANLNQENNRGESPAEEFQAATNPLTVTYDLMNHSQPYSGIPQGGQGGPFRNQIIMPNGVPNVTFQNAPLYQSHFQNRQSVPFGNMVPRNKGDTVEPNLSFEYQQELSSHYDNGNLYDQGHHQRAPSPDPLHLQLHLEKPLHQQPPLQTQHSSISHSSISEHESQAKIVAQPQPPQSQMYSQPHPNGKLANNIMVPKTPVSSGMPSGTSNSQDVPSLEATDIERFIYMFADKFFNDHHCEYPKSVTVFQEFKNTFFNERILNLRSIQRHILQQVAHSEQAPSNHQPERRQLNNMTNLVQTLQLDPMQQHILPHLQQTHQQQMPGMDDFFFRNPAVASQGLSNETSINEKQSRRINDDMSTDTKHNTS